MSIYCVGYKLAQNSSIAISYRKNQRQLYIYIYIYWYKLKIYKVIKCSLQYNKEQRGTLVNVKLPKKKWQKLDLNLSLLIPQLLVGFVSVNSSVLVWFVFILCLVGLRLPDCSFLIVPLGFYNVHIKKNNSYTYWLQITLYAPTKMPVG